ncbi:MAG: hypothetical protein WA323_26820, partial [Candidatus Nitrosopolaris sp.]
NITNEELSAVVGTYKEYSCAVVLEDILDKRYGIQIPHSSKHRAFKNHGFASNDPNTQKRREHTMSL